jgi:hypothetical protein
MIALSKCYLNLIMNKHGIEANISNNSIYKLK